MKNNKGYTLIELMVVLAVSSIVLYGVIYMPLDIMQEQAEYSEFVDSSSDVHILRKAIVKDLTNEYVKVEDSKTIVIGDNVYTFGDKVKRENTEITENAYSFEFANNKLKIFNENVNLEYSVGSSFSSEVNSNE